MHVHAYVYACKCTSRHVKLSEICDLRCRCSHAPHFPKVLAVSSTEPQHKIINSPRRCVFILRCANLRPANLQGGSGKSLFATSKYFSTCVRTAGLTPPLQVDYNLNSRVCVVFLGLRLLDRVAVDSILRWFDICMVNF